MPEGSLMLYIPFGSSEPNQEPWPPAKIKTAALPSFIIFAPLSLNSLDFCSSKELFLEIYEGSIGMIDVDSTGLNPTHTSLYNLSISSRFRPFKDSRNYSFWLSV